MNQMLLTKDLARLSGQSIHTVKYYLKIGLIREIGRCPTTRFRYFDQTTLHRLAEIRQLRKEDTPIREIQGLFTRK